LISGQVSNDHSKCGPVLNGYTKMAAENGLVLGWPVPVEQAH
jgi:hypothetical protein